MSDEKLARSCVCMFCGEGFGYVGEKPDEATIKAAYDHESSCRNNPYLARIAELEAEILELKQAVENGREDCCELLHRQLWKERDDGRDEINRLKSLLRQTQRLLADGANGAIVDTVWCDDDSICTLWEAIAMELDEEPEEIDLAKDTD